MVYTTDDYNIAEINKFETIWKNLKFYSGGNCNINPIINLLETGMDGIDFSGLGGRGENTTNALVEALKHNHSLRYVKAGSLYQDWFNLFLDALANSTNLQVLVLSNNTMDIAAIRKLIVVLEKNTGLKVLSLLGCRLTGEGLKLLTPVLKNMELECLNLFLNRRVNDDGIHAISEILESNKLKALDITNYKLNDEQIKLIISKLKDNLIKLNLAENKIKLKGANLSTMFVKNTNLMYLNLSGNNIDVNGIKTLFLELKCNTTLKQLYLNHTGITQESIDELCFMLKVNTTIQVLSLSRNNIGDLGLEKISCALQTNTSLRELYLDETGITSESGIHIASMLKVNTTIQVLSLSENNIGDLGVEQIVGALNYNNTLRELYLRKKSIHIKIILNVVDLLKEKFSLQKIDLLEKTSLGNLSEEGHKYFSDMNLYMKRNRLFNAFARAVGCEKHTPNLANGSLRFLTAKALADNMKDLKTYIDAGVNLTCDLKLHIFDFFHGMRKIGLIPQNNNEHSYSREFSEEELINTFSVLAEYVITGVEFVTFNLHVEFKSEFEDLMKQFSIALEAYGINNNLRGEYLLITPSYKLLQLLEKMPKDSRFSLLIDSLSDSDKNNLWKKMEEDKDKTNFECKFMKAFGLFAKVASAYKAKLQNEQNVIPNEKNGSNHDSNKEPNSPRNPRLSR